MTDPVAVYVRQRSAPDLTFHRPQYVYEATCPVWSTPIGVFEDGEVRGRRVICQLTSNVNESILWCDDDCRESQEWTQLKKCWSAMGTAFATVWQDTDIRNLTTGRVETDAKKMQRYLDQRSEEEGERLGMKVDFQMVDPTDTDALGVTDEGLDATHDHRVRTGQKDSRGRFVFPV